MTYHVSMIGELPNPSEKQIFQKHVDGEANRNYSIFCMTSREAHPLKRIQINSVITSWGLWSLLVCMVSWWFQSQAAAGGGVGVKASGFYLENTLHAENLKSFSVPVIKVSVLDVLLKWIFHVSHRCPKHFSIDAVWLFMCACVCICEMNHMVNYIHKEGGILAAEFKHCPWVPERKFAFFLYLWLKQTEYKSNGKIRVI